MFNRGFTMEPEFHALTRKAIFIPNTSAIKINKSKREAEKYMVLELNK